MKAVLTRVYQSGHQDVYCDGESHVWLSGAGSGTCGIDSGNGNMGARKGKCDCDKYKDGGK